MMEPGEKVIVALYSGSGCSYALVEYLGEYEPTDLARAKGATRGMSFQSEEPKVLTEPTYVESG